VDKETSDLPCIIAYDLGKTEYHRSVIAVGELQIGMVTCPVCNGTNEVKGIKCKCKDGETEGDGSIHIIKIIEFPKDAPFWDIECGVLNTCADLLKNYPNTSHIIGDASGLAGKDRYPDMQQLVMERGFPPDMVVPFKWSGSSEEFGGGKGPLVRGTVIPKIEQNMIKCIYNQRLRIQMSSWKATQTTSGNVVLKPKKQTIPDDILTTIIQIMWMVFYKGTRGGDNTLATAPSLFTPNNELRFNFRNNLRFKGRYT
jgi:hypothetical protein